MRGTSIILFSLIPFTMMAQFGSQVRLLTTEPPEKWKTVELGIQFPEQERSFRMFIDDHSRGINPYISRFLWMQFSCNGVKYLRPAFYMEEVVPDEPNNQYVSQQSEWPWRVRFAPPIAGDYECVLLAGEDPATATPQSTGVRFHVSESSRHGILRTVPGEPRLHFSDGTPFFILGQNIAWCNAQLRGGPLKELWPVYVSGYYEFFHYIHHLADNGGNYVRIVLAPWGFSIDHKAVNVYEQDRAFVIDSIMHIAENRNLYVHFVIELTNGFFANIPRDQWHPIRLAYQKEGMTAADLLKDSAALAAFDNHIRYVHARWAYSANLAVLEVIPEHVNWEGYKEHKENFSDYLTHVNLLMRNELRDSLHIINTGTDIHDLTICKNPYLAFVDIHHYDNTFMSNHRRYFYYHKKTDQFRKPFLIGEMGITTGRDNGCDPDDWEYCSDISRHNALWSTAFHGNMGPGLYWWQWHNDKQREANFKPLRWFIDSVAEGMHEYTDAGKWDGNGLEVFYCRKDSKWGAVGWIHNTSYWWGNTTDTCVDRANRKMLMPKDDDEPRVPEARIGNTFVISGMMPNKKYRIRYYDTRTHEYLGGNIVKSGIFGRIKLKMPAEVDCAFELHRFEYSVF